MDYQVHYQVEFEGTCIEYFDNLESALEFIKACQEGYWPHGELSLYQVKELDTY